MDLDGEQRSAFVRHVGSISWRSQRSRSPELTWVSIALGVVSRGRLGRRSFCLGVSIRLSLGLGLSALLLKQTGFHTGQFATVSEQLFNQKPLGIDGPPLLYNQRGHECVGDQK